MATLFVFDLSAFVFSPREISGSQQWVQQFFVGHTKIFALQTHANKYFHEMLDVEAQNFLEESVRIHSSEISTRHRCPQIRSDVADRENSDNKAEGVIK